MTNAYRYSAHFAGRICEECFEHFSNINVAIYRSKEEECPDRPNIKKAFKQLSEEEFKEMHPNLLSEGETDDIGKVEISIDPEKTDYQGECIEVVITFKRFVGSDKELEHPEHFRIAFYKPQWDPTEKGYVHYGDFILPANLWCAYLRKHGIWVICGQVTTCAKPVSPVGNVTVKAYDVDWIQDDYLGSASTDTNGWFFIYYDRSKFTRTPFSPFINIEWTGGPDVYFKVEGVDTDGNTVILLDEPPSRGRKPDRENISNCFCTKLCVELVPQPDPYEVPMWTHIGNYQIPDSANMHDFIAEGYAKTNNLAFFSNMDFIGQTGRATAAKNLRYRFLYAEWTGITSPTPTNPVTKDMIAKTKVGQIITSISPLILEPVYVNNPSAAHNHEPDSAGWIEVEDDPMFTPVTNKLISLISTKLAPTASYSNPSPNPNAGNPTSIDEARKEHKFAIRYQLEADTGSGWVLVHDQTMEALVINNASTLLWLELDEFIVNSNMCQPIINTVTVKYTVDHPHLDWYEVEIEKQGANMHWPVPRINHSGSLTFRGGNGTTGAINISTWDPCSYIVFLRAHRRVTNGYSQPANEYVYRTFCKS
jgi:hypothetical protein